MPFLLYKSHEVLNKSNTDDWNWGSGGGIVAAALGATKLDIDQGISAFKGLASKAFKKRTGVDIPFLGKLIVAHHHGKYKTSGLEAVLKDIFGHDHLFGARVNEGRIQNLKVGVIATSSNRQTILLTNYNRPPPERKSAKTIDVRNSEEADERDIDADDRSEIMYDNARVSTSKETGERTSFSSNRTGSRDAANGTPCDPHFVAMCTDLPEVYNPEESVKSPRQSTEAGEWDGSSGNFEDSHSEIVDSRRYSYSSGWWSFLMSSRWFLYFLPE